MYRKLGVNCIAAFIKTSIELNVAGVGDDFISAPLNDKLKGRLQDIADSENKGIGEVISIILTRVINKIETNVIILKKPLVESLN